MTELPILVAPLDLEILCNQNIISANSMDISAAQTAEEELEYLRTAPGNEILYLLHTVIDSTQLLLLYLAELCNEDRIMIVLFRPGLAWAGFGFLKHQARPKPSNMAWPWPGLA